MRAAQLLSPTTIALREVARPAAGPGEVLIETARLGICGSDISFYQGHRTVAYPLTLGHELLGHVVAVGSGVTNIAVGQRVTVEPNYCCGECRFCREGRGNICPHKRSMGVTLPGCFADFAVAPAEFTWVVPDAIGEPDAAAIEPLAVSVHAVLQSGARAGDTVAVVGCGVVGLLVTHVAAAMGVRVLALDRFEDKRAIARSLGAETPAAEDLAAVWLDAQVSAVFECAGAAATVELAIANAPRGSRVLLLGLANHPASFVPLRLVREGVTIEPSLIYDHPSDFARTIALVAKGTLRPSKIIGATFPLASIQEALDLASKGETGKVQLTL